MEKIIPDYGWTMAVQSPAIGYGRPFLSSSLITPNATASRDKARVLGAQIIWLELGAPAPVLFSVLYRAPSDVVQTHSASK